MSFRRTLIDGYFFEDHLEMILESVDLYNGIIFALILFFLEILRAIFYSLFFAISYRLGMRLRSGLVTLVMQKGNYSKLRKSHYPRDHERSCTIYNLILKSKK